MLTLGLARARIGFERKFLVAYYYEELLTRLPQVSWTGCDRLFDELRMVKSDEEIARLTRAAHVTDA